MITPNQYILEARYHDKINRVRKKEHVGVYKNLQDVEKIKENLTNLKKYDDKYTISFKIYTNYDPFCA